MRITLLHPPHTAIGSRVPGEHLPPFGLLCLGGPLIDAGHQVTLVNADPAPMTLPEVIARVAATAPEAILIGHSGSTSVHPTVAALAPGLKAACPGAWIIYGGVYPTYHWDEILAANPAIDVIVRGEGEATAPRLIAALAAPEPDRAAATDGAAPRPASFVDRNTAPAPRLASSVPKYPGDRGSAPGPAPDAPPAWDAIAGLAFRRDGRPVATPPAAMIADLDACRIGWELIDHAAHSYWGGRRAVILQFSRGCPHLCTYCGQRGFWTRWRHRDPVRFAAEIARLYREHGVTLINLADENPTSSRKAWEAFLHAMIAQAVPVTIIGSTRADDIVRDADILHLYKRAGVRRFLMGLEGTDEATLATLKKGGTRPKDREAIRLLRAHGMIGLVTFAVGFARETDADYWRLLRHLLSYDPDQVMSVYATPHRWTPWFDDAKDRRVIDTDLTAWDYKHQVMEVAAVPPWRVALWVRLIEVVLQLRPKSLWRTYLHPDPEHRHAMRWYSRMGRRVVWHEARDWLRRRHRPGPTVAQFIGPDRLAENAMAKRSA